jgi:hypothetical protein
VHRPENTGGIKRCRKKRGKKSHHGCRSKKNITPSSRTMIFLLPLSSMLALDILYRLERAWRIRFHSNRIGNLYMSSSNNDNDKKKQNVVPPISPCSSSTHPLIPMSPSPSIRARRSLVLLAFFDVPFPPRARRPLSAAGAISPVETGVAAPEGLALASSKCPSPVGKKKKYG